MRSLQTKLILAITALVVLLFAGTLALFVNEKQRELTEDILVNARAFAELTAPDVVNSYNLYLVPKSFVYFRRDIQELLNKNQDITNIQLIHYTGKILYDAATEKDKQYEGPERMIGNEILKQQIQAKHPSLLTREDSRVFYYDKDEQGNIVYMDFNENPLPPLPAAERVAYLVQPVGDDMSVVYTLSYHQLDARLQQTVQRGVIAAGIGILIGIVLAVLYSRSLTRPLRELTEGARIVATGDLSHRVVVRTHDEIRTLANAFNSMAEDLEESTKALVYKERVAKELELASKIQNQLIPTKVPSVPGLNISAGLIPAEEIGGDAYDFILPDNKNLLMYLGDVTGHGVPSGIVGSIVNALMYSYAGTVSMKDILLQANKILRQKTASNMFMTLVMLHWSLEQQKLRYVSAGHEQMIHYHGADGKVTLTPAGGLALGMMDNIEQTLVEQEIEFALGDSLILYSDGIPECWRNQEEMYGIARFKRAVTEYGSLVTAQEIQDALLADVQAFRGDWKQMDDITIMVLKRV